MGLLSWHPKLCARQVSFAFLDLLKRSLLTAEGRSKSKARPETYLGTQMRSLTARTFTACRCWLKVSPSMGLRSCSDLSEAALGS